MKIEDVTHIIPAGDIIWVQGTQLKVGYESLLAVKVSETVLNDQFRTDALECSVAKGRAKSVVDLYLDYVNNFLTPARFAEYYNLEVGVAEKLLAHQRSLTVMHKS